MSAIRTMNWDAVVASSPQDKTAAMVRDGVGTDNGYRDTNGFLSRQEPFPLVEKLPTDASFQDLTGVKLGRFVIVGLIDAKAMGGVTKSLRGSRWSARCACGNFQYLKGKTIRKFLAESRADLRCSECDYLNQIKQGHVADVPLCDREGYSA